MSAIEREERANAGMMMYRGSSPCFPDGGRIPRRYEKTKDRRIQVTKAGVEMSRDEKARILRSRNLPLESAAITPKIMPESDAMSIDKEARRRVAGKQSMISFETG
jgi:hypothetical protein